MARKLSIKEAKQRAARFCALRERSPHEVLDKIKTWGLSADEALEVVEVLSKEGYVDERRFANAYCHDKFEFNSWGKQKIKASIYPHKLASQLIDEALDRIDPKKYESKLLYLARKKWDSLYALEEHKKKQRTVSYLSGKGFELDLIWNAIHSISDKGH